MRLLRLLVLGRHTLLLAGTGLAIGFRVGTRDLEGHMRQMGKPLEIALFFGLGGDLGTLAGLAFLLLFAALLAHDFFVLDIGLASTFRFAFEELLALGLGVAARAEIGLVFHFVHLVRIAFVVVNKLGTLALELEELFLGFEELLASLGVDE